MKTIRTFFLLLGLIAALIAARQSLMVNHTAPSILLAEKGEPGV
jgi:hypothetical protein